MNKPMTIKEIEKEWWAEINKLCKRCKKECKQSNKVTVLDCPSYQPK